MDVALLISRLFLSAVFAIAGAAKLFDREGSKQSLADFGVPESLVRPLTWVLPIAEIITAVALIPAASAWLGGLGGSLLLIAFTIGIATKLARGEEADCHCFGKLHSGPIGWQTLARNLAFTGIAGLVVIGGWNGFAISAVDWLADLKTPEVVILLVSTAVLTLVAAAFIHIRRISSDLSSALEQIAAVKKVVDEDYAEPQPVEREEFKLPKAGLPIGAPAPDFILENLDGELVSLDNLLVYGKPLVLLFVSPSCPSCKNVLADLEGWQRDYSAELTFAVLSKGVQGQVRNKLTKFGARHILLQGEPAIGERYKTTWTPAAVLVTAKGKIASSVANGDMEVRSLVENARATAEAFEGGSLSNRGDEVSLYSLGEVGPEFSARDLSGNLITTSDLRGRDNLLMFWHPDCPWCVKMLEDIRIWEANPPKGAPALTIITSTDAEDVAHLVKDIRSTVLVDPEAEIALSFDSKITPAGIVIDSEGRIASGLVVGVKDVLALAGIEHVRALVDSVV